MGQTLDKPITEKDTIIGGNDFLTFGCSCVQGYRVSMEDRHNTIPNVNENVPAGVKSLLDKTKTTLSFFGVYDGHSGDSCADFLSKNLLNHVLKAQETAGTSEQGTILENNKVIEDGFMKADEEFAQKLGNNDSGTTAVTTFVRKTNDTTEIICANTGDSRCVLYEEGKTVPMSFDHKPQNEEEKKRIKDAGGYVEFGRVNGTLAVSRAFGDLVYKDNSKLDLRKQAVTALPDVKRHTLSKSSGNAGDYKFLILACDGVWDVMDNEAATKYVVEKLNEQKTEEYWNNRYEKLKAQAPAGTSLKKEQHGPQFDQYHLGYICEDMLDHCVQTLDSKDNCSVIIVLFK